MNIKQGISLTKPRAETEQQGGEEQTGNKLHILQKSAEE